jgi:hypothetical protein
VLIDRRLTGVIECRLVSPKFSLRSSTSSRSSVSNTGEKVIAPLCGGSGEVAAYSEGVVIPVSVVAIDEDNWFVFSESVEERESPRNRPSGDSSINEVSFGSVGGCDSGGPWGWKLGSLATGAVPSTVLSPLLGATSSGCLGKKELKLLEPRKPRREIMPPESERICIWPVEGAWERRGDVATGIEVVEVAADGIDDGSLGSGRIGIEGLVSLFLPTWLNPALELE